MVPDIDERGTNVVRPHPALTCRRQHDGTHRRGDRGRGLPSWFAVQNASKRWNILYRRSTDGGATWSPSVKISDASSGAGYKNANGFLEFYGDYGEIAITNQGKTVAAWGEGFSWVGPGNVWINVET